GGGGGEDPGPPPEARGGGSSPGLPGVRSAFPNASTPPPEEQPPTVTAFFRRRSSPRMRDRAGTKRVVIGRAKKRNRENYETRAALCAARLYLAIPLIAALSS